MTSSKTQTVDEYITSFPASAKKKLQELRIILQTVVPSAKESLKWGTPVFEEKRILFAYAAYKNHINFMPTPAVIVHFKSELADYNLGIASVQFPYNRPLPQELIKKLAAYRAKEVREHDAKWM